MTQKVLVTRLRSQKGLRVKLILKSTLSKDSEARPYIVYDCIVFYFLIHSFREGEIDQNRLTKSIVL